MAFEAAKKNLDLTLFFYAKGLTKRKDVVIFVPTIIFLNF